MSTLHRLALCLLALSLSAPAFCVPVADVEEHELALIDSLPLLAEPDLEHVDGGLAMDESELAVERITPDATWNASIEYADPSAPSIEGNYGFMLSARHAQGFRFAFARDRKQIVLSEALAFGKKTLLRVAIGNTQVESREIVNGRDAQLVERTRSMELTRRVYLPQTAIELGIGAHDTDGVLANGGEAPAALDSDEEDEIGMIPGRRRELWASLSVVPEFSAVRFDMGMKRQVLSGASGAGYGQGSNGYRLRAIGQLQRCRVLDIAYSGIRETRSISAHLDAATWRVGVSAAHADGDPRPTVSLSLVIELPLEGRRSGSTGCREEFTFYPERRELVNEVTVMPAWRTEG